MDRRPAFNGSFCALLRNDGGRFTDVSESAGIQVRTPDLKVPVGKSLGVAPYDVDGDGLVDIAVANDTVQNFLFHNQGHGKFEEIAILRAWRSTSRARRVGAWGSTGRASRTTLARPGHRQLRQRDDRALRVRRAASRSFSDLANIYGLAAPTQPPLKFGLFFFDYDLDGRLDLLSANGHLERDISKVQASETYEQSVQLFWNTGQPGRSLYVAVKAENCWVATR